MLTAPPVLTGTVDDLSHDEQRPHARPLTAALQFREEEGQHSVREGAGCRDGKGSNGECVALRPDGLYPWYCAPWGSGCHGRLGLGPLLGSVTCKDLSKTTAPWLHDLWRPFPPNYFTAL